jgi:beta-xylosidase
VGVADKITGPYKHISYIKGGACDTSLFADTDGRTYAVIPRGGMGIHIQQIDLTRIDEDQVELLGQPALIMAPSNKDIGVETNPKTVEGPWLEKINGRYYLFHAAYYTDQAPPEWEGYWVNVAVADAVGGPYKKDPRGKLFLGGHAAIFNGPKGVKYFSYRNEVNGSPEHRKLSIDPFIIDSNGQVQTPAPAQQIKR